MSRVVIGLWIVLGIAAAGIVALWLLAWRPAIAPVSPPRQVDAARIARGRSLALVGNCRSCHQARHGKPFAGGYPVRTPFGTIMGSNITPDLETGIGRWSLAAFTRALREGVSRDGHQLYPAFPYDHFNQVNDADIAALYAFLMAQPPVRAAPPANRLIPPLGFRPVIAVWKWLAFRPAPFRPDPSRPADWNRGAYLATGLAHCGACHTPHDRIGAEQRDRAFAGGMADGWFAPPLNAQSPAVRKWDADRLFVYLSTGLSPQHSAAAGPMGAVTHGLARADPSDVRAIATYVAANMAAAPAARLEPALADRAEDARRRYPLGATLYAGACATCHEPGAAMMVAGRPPLALGTPLHETSPRDTLAILLAGIQPPTGRAGPLMPAFADSFDDAQLAALAGYLRARFGSGAPWPDLAREAARARKEVQR